MSTPEKTSRPATSLDVARYAGVSRSTVSNILNGNAERFQPSTRERVLAAASALDYRPSLAGRSLVSGKSDTVVVLLPHTTFGSNLQSAVDEVVANTHQIGGNVVVRFAADTPQATVSAITALRPLAVVDFGVLREADLDAIERQGSIVVPSARRYRSTALDGGIAQLQADALLAHGPRALWFAALADEREDPFGPGRYAALCDYSRTHGLAAPKTVDVPLSVSGASEALHTITTEGTPVGVACYNDDVALALLAAAREEEVAVPETVALVGVDHTPIGQLWSPRVTTIDTHLPSIVTALTKELQARLEGHAPDVREPATLPFTLVEGETS